ncbi:MAG: 5'-nucleotidase [Chloroflexi bacterium]|nr:MAG: 5'-nucleotidase [Chloroflexota bacterium]MBA4376139.1 bifunctional metallophosphatase/5'-nucleotidase [Anaerolinea sp.]
MRRTRIKFMFSVLTTIFLLASLFITGLAAPKQTVAVQILAVNDFHGALVTSGARGGVEYMATLVKQKRAENENTIFVSAGDMVGASPLISALFHDEPTILAFNLMGLDYAITGNHEFDEGVQELKRLQEGGCHPVDGCLAGDFPGASFKFLAGNVINLKNGQTLFSSYKIRSFAGAKVAFVGIAYDKTPTIVTAAGTAGVEFLDETTAVNAIAAELKEKGIKTIVMLIHDGGSQGVPSASLDPNACINFSGSIANVVNASDPEIDLFITGHTHGAYNCNISDRLVTGALTNGEYITEIDLVLDRDSGDIVSKTVLNVPVLKTVAKDPEMTALVDKYQALSAPLANRVIGSITADILRYGDRTRESPLGDVIADAQLASTSAPEKGGAVAAFMNPGGIRASFTYAQISAGEQPGEITYGEAFTVQPFGNDLVTMTLTGAQIKAVLEQQATTNLTLQISNGVTYTWTKSAAVGSRVTDLKFYDVPVDPALSYQITVNSFLATGGDGFTVLTQGTNRLVGQVDIDALVDYFRANSPVAPGLANRITVLP